MAIVTNVGPRRVYTIGKDGWLRVLRKVLVHYVAGKGYVAFRAVPVTKKREVL